MNQQENKNITLLFQYLENATDGIIVHDDEFKIIFYNKAFCELCKVNNTELLHLDISSFFFTINNLIQLSYNNHELIVKGNLAEKLLYETEIQEIKNGADTFYINRIALNISLKIQDKTHKSILSFAEEIPDSVVIINFEGRILYSNYKNPKVDHYLKNNFNSIIDKHFDDSRNHIELEIVVENKTYMLSIGINHDLSLCNFYAKDITPRKIAEKKLYQEEERFKKIALVSGAYVWETDSNLKLTYISKLAEDIHGMTIDQFQRKSILDLAHVDDRSEMRDFLKKSLQLNSSFKDLQYRTILPNGNVIWFYCSGSPLYNENREIVGLSGVSLDFTRTRQQTIALSQTYHQISRILSKMKSGIILVNSENRIKHINNSFTRMFSLFDNESVVGKNLHLILNTLADKTKDPKQFIKSTIGQLEKNVEVFGEVFEMKDDTYLERDFQPIYSENELEGYLWSYRNITNQKNHEKQLKQAIEQAENANKLKSKFISNVSHEIRTPMNGILGLLQILQNENPNEAQKKYLDTIRFSANNLLAIINDLLDIHKIEAGKMTFDKLPFSLNEIILNIESTYNQIALSKNLYLKININVNMPKVLIGDATRIGQIINNLVSNSFKFTSEGGITLSFDYKEISQNHINLMVSVMDTGIGIAKEKHSTIFESFIQGELDTTRIYGGTGLGLSLCKAFVENMNGTINIESERGKGAHFYFSIPIEVSNKRLPEQNSIPITQEEIDKIKKMKILLVEDNPVNQLIVKRIAANWELDLDIANDGQQAIDILIENKKFDVILMDIKMPRKDGYQTTAEIREMEDEYYKNIPIVAITASAMKNDKEKLMNSGMNEHLLKPFQIEDLFQILQQININRS